MSDHYLLVMADDNGEIDEVSVIDEEEEEHYRSDPSYEGHIVCIVPIQKVVDAINEWVD